MKTLFELLGVVVVLSCVPALVLFLRARRRFSGLRVVRCPETDRLASICLDANRAAFSELSGDPGLHVKACSRWAGPVGHCFEQCLEPDHSNLPLAGAK
jgi:hypothetical protein